MPRKKENDTVSRNSVQERSCSPGTSGYQKGNVVIEANLDVGCERQSKSSNRSTLRPEQAQAEDARGESPQSLRQLSHPRVEDAGTDAAVFAEWIDRLRECDQERRL